MGGGMCGAALRFGEKLWAVGGGRAGEKASAWLTGINGGPRRSGLVTTLEAVAGKANVARKRGSPTRANVVAEKYNHVKGE